jgi:hypothetical protein
MWANYAKRAFHPILPSPYKVANGDVIVKLVSDAVQDYSGELRVRVFNLSSFTPVLDTTLPSVSSSFLKAPEVHRIPAANLTSIGCGSTAVSPCFVYLSMGDGIPDNFLWLHYPKDTLMDPELRVTQFTSTPGMKSFTVTLASDAVAPFVFLNLKDSNVGKWSDNGFIMVENTKVLTYSSNSPLSLQSFIDQFDMVSLFDVTALA